MAVKITRNDLAKFKSKVERIDGIADNLARMFVEEALEIAREKYSGLSELEDLYVEKLEDGVYNLIAEGDKLCYIEFGTGKVGEGTYPDPSKLPDQTLEFDSPKGIHQETKGWDYYYDNPATKMNGGWFYGKEYGEFTYGQKAKAQMFYTAEELAQSIVDIARDYIRGGKQ